MGDAADDYTDFLENKAIYPFGVDVLIADTVRDKNRATLANYEWTTREGKRVKFKDMSLSHLLNVVKMQERGKHRYAPQLRDYYQYRVTVETPIDF